MTPLVNTQVGPHLILHACLSDCHPEGFPNTARYHFLCDLWEGLLSGRAKTRQMVTLQVRIQRWLKSTKINQHTASQVLTMFLFTPCAETFGEPRNNKKNYSQCCSFNVLVLPDTMGWTFRNAGVSEWLAFTLPTLAFWPTRAIFFPSDSYHTLGNPDCGEASKDPPSTRTFEQLSLHVAELSWRYRDLSPG